MRPVQFALALLAASILTACGGSSSGDQSLKTRFGAQISFGDSLSDVGTYAVGTVQALGGGRFTINGDNSAVNPALTGKNWTELMAAQFGLPAPCPAQTGLQGDAAQGFSVPVVNHPGCYGYAQGGSRVTNPIGQGNALTGSPLGALTVPVSTQIARHLALSGGKFKPDDIVFVMAGGNDALAQLAILQSGAEAAGQAAGSVKFASTLVSLLAAGATDPLAAAAAIGLALATESANPAHTSATLVAAAVGAAALQPGNAAVASPAVYGPMVTQAQADAAAAGASAGANFVAANGAAAVAAMASAGDELVALVKNQIVANGANFVTVNNLPDLASTPAGRAEAPAVQALILAMTEAFNAKLANGLAGEPKVLVVDVFAVSHDEAVNPGPYGLTNVSDTACDLSPAKNPLGNALVCNAGNLKPGDVSHYAYADDVHPTPFNNLLLARYVAEKLVVRGWL
jgi:outer membrane lipase/esterase